MLIYFLSIFVVVKVYSSTGHFQPAFPDIKPDIHAFAPLYREMWFGWDETPCESKVIRTSIVVAGAWEVDDLVDFLVWLAAALNAEASTSEILSVGQFVVMPSGKLASSRMSTSDAERRPSFVADFASSSFRTSPKPSAFPVHCY